jgi:hypothetical protein
MKKPDATRYSLSCRDAGERCSLNLAGPYDTVLAEGAAHWRRAHGARGPEAEVRAAVAELMRQETGFSLWPLDEPAAAGRPDWPF